MKIVSQDEWKKRLEEVKLASEDCSTIAEIVEITNYSRYILKQLFTKFPDEEKKVKDNLAKNKASKKESYSTEIHQKITHQKDDGISIVMLDTSVNHVNNIFRILEEYVQNAKTLGITDVALEELAALQKGNEGRDACNFLHIIMNNITSFKLFEVKHSMKEKETVDEAIIRATLERKDDTLLLTSDKEMYIKATLKGANAQYLSIDNEEKSKAIFDINKVSKPKIINQKYLVSLVDVIVENMQVTYEEKNRPNQLIKVFSRKGQEKQGNKIPLEIGDHIFICTAKEDYITFADYETYDITQNSFRMRFNNRLYHFETEVNVAIPEYKKFIEEARKTLIK